MAFCFGGHEELSLEQKESKRVEKKSSVVTRIERASTLECTWLQEPHILYVDFNLEKYNYFIGTDHLLILFYPPGQTWGHLNYR